MVSLDGTAQHTFLAYEQLVAVLQFYERRVKLEFYRSQPVRKRYLNFNYHNGRRWGGDGGLSMVRVMVMVLPASTE